MMRGFTKFVCDECGHKFKAPDIEYQCTAYSCPVICPECGSRHTMPCGMPGGLFGECRDKAAYKKIWAELDRKENKQ